MDTKDYHDNCEQAWENKCIFVVLDTFPIFKWPFKKSQGKVNFLLKFLLRNLSYPILVSYAVFNANYYWAVLQGYKTAVSLRLIRTFEA